MPTTLSGPVRLPNGVTPTNGRITFRRRDPDVAATITLPGPIEALINADGTFSLILVQGIYSVLVEYRSDSELIAVQLPDIVVSGSGTATLSDVSVVQVPPNSDNTVTIKQGATLNLALQYLDANNRPQSMMGVSVNAYVSRDARIPLTLRYIDQAAGTFEATLPAATTATMSGTYELVVRLAAARVEIRTGTLIVEEVA